MFERIGPAAGWLGPIHLADIAVHETHVLEFARRSFAIAAQVAALWLVNRGASAVVSWSHVPIPGNVVGLVALFALLCAGIVKLSWLEPAATLLVKHLAFFFIPITIGLIAMGPLFARHGAGMFLALVASAAIGMALSGLTSQYLINAQNASRTRRGPRTGA